MRGLAIRTSQDWIDYFRGNGFVAMRVPWHLGPDLRADEKSAIAHSIQLFQLGESSEGRHLMRYARDWSYRSGDCAYPEAVRMLIAEEQRHASALARFMEINGIPRIARGSSDWIFRRLRHFIGALEISITVLVTAEIIAKIYYPALRMATGSFVLREICQQVHREEVEHVRFQAEQLARLRAGRTDWGIRATALLHRILFYGTAGIVGFSHRMVLRRGGLRFWPFMAACRHEFLRDLAAMDPRNHAADIERDAAVARSIASPARRETRSRFAFSRGKLTKVR